MAGDDWAATADNFLGKSYGTRSWNRVAPMYEAAIQGFVDQRPAETFTGGPS